MEKSDPPTTLGAFKPVGHTVIAFAAAADMEAAANTLYLQGFAPADMTRYQPAEMLAQADSELLNASPLAALGKELDVIEAHRALAENGYSFLVVHAPKDAQAEQVAAVARSSRAASAQRYTRFIIEELIDHPAGEAQAFPLPRAGMGIGVSAEAAGR